MFMRARLLAGIAAGLVLAMIGMPAALASEASGQRGNSIVRAHSASEDARERAGDTRPEPGSSARASAIGQAGRPIRVRWRRPMRTPCTIFGSRLAPAAAAVTDGVTKEHDGVKSKARSPARHKHSNTVPRSLYSGARAILARESCTDAT